MRYAVGSGYCAIGAIRLRFRLLRHRRNTPLAPAIASGNTPPRLRYCQRQYAQLWGVHDRRVPSIAHNIDGVLYKRSQRRSLDGLRQATASVRLPYVGKEKRRQDKD